MVFYYKSWNISSFSCNFVVKLEEGKHILFFCFDFTLWVILKCFIICEHVLNAKFKFFIWNNNVTKISRLFVKISLIALKLKTMIKKLLVTWILLFVQMWHHVFIIVILIRICFDCFIRYVLCFSYKEKNEYICDSSCMFVDGAEHWFVTCSRTKKIRRVW